MSLMTAPHLLRDFSPDPEKKKFLPLRVVPQTFQLTSLGKNQSWARTDVGNEC